MPFIVVSVILHATVLVLVVNGTQSDDKNVLQKDTNKINSYLVLKPPLPAAKTVQHEPEIDTSILSTQIKQPEISIQKQSQVADNTELSSNVGLIENTPSSKQGVVAASDVKADVTQKANQLIINKKVSSTSIQARTSRYIQEANKAAFESLSDTALHEFSRPKPIVAQSSATASRQIQKALDATFAHPSTGISVVSQLNNETLILHGDACFSVKETALEDRVHRGASVWVRSGACGSKDKFNGQLKVSLDKYLKK